MALFRKKKSADEIKSEISRLETELREMGAFPEPPPESGETTKKPKAAQVPANTHNAPSDSTSNALFVTLSHELRTPLNGVLGIAQLLREEVQDPRLDTLESCALHMQSVLHSLVNLTKIQQNWAKLPEHKEWLNLHDVMEQTKKKLTQRALSRKLKIDIQHENKALRLRCDYDHLTNIIETAILASLECSEPAPSTETAMLQITWRANKEEIKIILENPLETPAPNRGEHISKLSDLKQLNSNSRIRMEYLYWAVSTSLLEYYQGAMIATTPDKGGVKTTLAFKMERMEASPSSERAVGGLTLNPDNKHIPILKLPVSLKILIAEDDPVNRQIILLLLERLGQSAEIAVNGQEALDKMTADPTFDVILMDVDMPVLDGLATTQAIRMGETGESGMNIPIIAVTAFNTLSDRGRFQKAGMNHVLFKPVSVKDLRSVLLDVINKAAPKV